MKTMGVHSCGLLAVAVAATLASGSVVRSQPAPGGWALPAPPDVSALNTAFPNCVLDTLDSSHKCLADLEFYRGQILETTYHLGSMRAYSRDLERMSSKLEIAHAAGQVSAADYQQVHDALSDALDAANKPEGLYQMTYFNYYKRYKDSAASAQRKIFAFEHQIS